MSIPNEYKNRCVYHFTHLENLPGILKHGLISTSEKKCLGISHTAISYTGIQERRSQMTVSCGPGGVVHDYVPLYYGKLSPMLLAVIRNKIVDEQFIIHLEFPIRLMNEYPAVFTDAAANTAKYPNFFTDPNDLQKLNWEAIDNRKWGMQTDELRQARMAELLVHRKINISSITQIIVWNDHFKKEVLSYYKEAGIAPPKVDFHDPYDPHYFIDFLDTNKHPPVTGPFLINQAYSETVKYIVQGICKSHSPKFKNLFELRDALDEDMTCVPETAEIVGLESDNKMHSETVDRHTRKVVEELRKLTDFQNMSKTAKLLIEIAAYLHDIGKGPKSRWINKGGRQKVDPDHPIKALPMVQRILTEDVGKMKASSARIICKLVCYHDLIGDIVAKGRRIEELEEVIENQSELEMIIALGKADMMAINPSWSLVYANDIDSLHKAMMAKLNFTD